MVLESVTLTNLCIDRVIEEENVGVGVKVRDVVFCLYHEKLMINDLG